MPRPWTYTEPRNIQISVSITETQQEALREIARDKMTSVSQVAFQILEGHREVRRQVAQVRKFGGVL